jgi:nitroimidazol reductase NimA-like FMN-containing flavoprotein (pyridoxamine 5'-phosphate oxidase superfamily)
VKALLQRSVANVLRDAPFAYLAVETASGPHVTPLLFAATPDRLWFGIGRRTLKARALAKRPAVGVVVPGETASVAVRGEAALLDGLPASPAELARAPFALPAFAFANAFEMAAFARDVGRGARPQPLAPVSVRIDTLDLLERWPADAVLGWSTDGGPVALPARWNSGTGRAQVPAAPLKAAGRARRAPACVCIDESGNALGPLAKRGRLLRGEGHATVRGDTASVALDPDRVTRWKGFEVQTAPVAGAGR